jgi:hypothetical protein
MRTKAVWMCGLVLLGSCKLIDQTTFEPSPEPKAAAQPVANPAPPKADPRTALLIIGYATADPDYQALLRYAVGAAETRAPGVQYDVIAILPAGGDISTAQRHAADVMQSIVDQGVAPSRVHLGLREAQAGSPQEVRVYVR